MAGRDRYDSNPTRGQGKKDIVDYVSEMMQRLGSGETVQRIGATAIEDGNLTVRNGDIIVSQSAGNVIWKLLHGTTPEIRWFPVGDTDDRRISFYSSNESSFQQTMWMQVETNPGATRDGGEIILSRAAGALIGYDPTASGRNESFLWMGIYENAAPSLPEVMVMQGKWTNRIQDSALMAVYPGQDSLGAGFTSFTHTYSSAFATTVVPIVTLFNSGGTVSWNLTAQSTSSFTVTWSGTAAKTINWWVFRI